MRGAVEVLSALERGGAVPVDPAIYPAAALQAAAARLGVGCGVAPRPDGRVDVEVRPAGSLDLVLNEALAPRGAGG